MVRFMPYLHAHKLDFPRTILLVAYSRLAAGVLMADQSPMHIRSVIYKFVSTGKSDHALTMHLRMKIPTFLAAFAIFLIAGALAQDAPPAPRFEVASIRPVAAGPGHDQDDNPSFIAYRAGKASSFCMICISGQHYDMWANFLKEMIARAFSIDSRLVVAPKWLSQPDGTKFTIHATMPKGATKEQIPDMLRALLEERFHLVAHLAPGEQTGYALVVAKNGPKLKPPRTMDRSACENWVAAIGADMEDKENQMCHTTRDDGDRTVNIAMIASTHRSPVSTESWRDGAFESHREYFRITMAQLATNLAQYLSTGSPGMPNAGSVAQVVDHTGIEGAWDVVLDETMGDLALSTISASLERQGLRLERTTVPVEKLIVDKIDKVQTEN